MNLHLQGLKLHPRKSAIARGMQSSAVKREWRALPRRHHDNGFDAIQLLQRYLLLNCGPKFSNIDSQ